MYIIKDTKRNAYRTEDGWTTIERQSHVKPRNANLLVGLEDVVRYTKGEMEANDLPDGQVWVYFPERKWEYIK